MSIDPADLGFDAFFSAQRDALPAEWVPARVVAEGAAVWNPAFDVTPPHLVTGIVTERGIAPPAELAGLFPERR